MISFIQIRIKILKTKIYLVKKYLQHKFYLDAFDLIFFRHTLDYFGEIYMFDLFPKNFYTKEFDYNESMIILFKACICYKYKYEKPYRAFYDDWMTKIRRSCDYEKVNRRYIEFMNTIIATLQIDDNENVLKPETSMNIFKTVSGYKDYEL